MLHLLGGIFWHHLRCFLRTGNWTGTRTGIRSVQCTVGILPVAEYDATHSHIGGTHLNLYMEAKKTKTTVKKEENRMCRFKSNISNNAEESPRTNVCADSQIFMMTPLIFSAVPVQCWHFFQSSTFRKCNVCADVGFDTDIHDLQRIIDFNQSQSKEIWFQNLDTKFF